MAFFESTIETWLEMEILPPVTAIERDTEYVESFRVK